jgi:uncharacterized glyoxalase superfamily protein PhnB
MFDPAQGYPRVVPYFRYTDPAAALRWLEGVLGATETLRMTTPDGRIGHVELAVGDAVISAGLAVGPPDAPAEPVNRFTLRAMTLVFVDDVDAAVARIPELGGAVLDGPRDQPWGLRQAILTDPEGYRWEPSTHLRDVTPQSWGAALRGTAPRSSRRAGEVMLAMVAMLSTGDLSGLEANVHADYVDHQGLGAGPVRGPAGFASVVGAARDGYSKLEVTVEDLISGTERAAARLRWQGLRRSGEPVDRETLEIVRITDDRAIEHWGGRS